MSEDISVFKWSGLKAHQVPKWVEWLVLLIGFPIVLGIIYYYIFPLVNDLVAGVIFIIIVLIGIWLAFKSEETGDVSLHIRVDDHQIACKFCTKTYTYDLRKLDWSKVRMTNELNSKLILKEVELDNEESFPIILMSKQDRRKLWQSISKYNEASK
jgi:hypothetical protein